ncbi:hypothetical protein [Glutamicibacter sp. ZJUTW]|uniref:hypothetical protein n=1 Tax=Glutamicibacter sp. ZJUTW TaxID=1155384 RepID=UPI0011F0DBB2|nr:hypothetical protein [Glutamicibacter sp. ZJUTW]QEP06155.1 hypothetical protein F0M17_02225 [Glutamicibacter sp. ZJUTW]
MSEKFDRESIISELKYEALEDPETGWLSDLASRDLEWEERDEVIVFGEWEGSIDVGHLAGIVESIISKRTADLTTRLEQAEQDRVKLRNRFDAMCRQRDGYRNQLRKTEEQIQKVRVELGYIPEDFSARIRRALDGDGRG